MEGSGAATRGPCRWRLASMAGRESSNAMTGQISASMSLPTRRRILFGLQPLVMLLLGGSSPCSNRWSCSCSADPLRAPTVGPTPALSQAWAWRRRRRRPRSPRPMTIGARVSPAQTPRSPSSRTTSTTRRRRRTRPRPARRTRLGGSIPLEIFNCTTLQRLDLSQNSFEGSFPNEVGRLPQLELLLFADNRLSGQMPPILGKLSHLTAPQIGGNQFSGGIPKELGLLSSLQIAMTLSYNNLSGNIPLELGSLALLESLFLNNNNLTEDSVVDNLASVDLSQEAWGRRLDGQGTRGLRYCRSGFSQSTPRSRT